MIILKQDFEKAFDKIEHKAMIDYESKGFWGKMVLLDEIHL